MKEKIHRFTSIGGKQYIYCEFADDIFSIKDEIYVKQKRCPICWAELNRNIKKNGGNTAYPA